jgi:hypothetical protein
MKYIVTLSELKDLIPETKSLEGVSFKDMKDLLIRVIREIEKSGVWEFVQYINTTPSIFIIKEKEQLQYVYKEALQEQSKNLEQKKKNKPKITQRKNKEKVEVSLGKNEGEESLFKNTDVDFPWKNS